jgi:hypothetical protein
MSLPARVIDDLCDTNHDWVMAGPRSILDPAGMADGALRLLEGVDTPEAARIRARWRLVLDILERGIASVPD